MKRCCAGLQWAGLGLRLMLLATLLVTGSREVEAQARRLIFEDTIIEATIQKPEINIFITRQNLNTEYDLELRESFLPKIVRSVEKGPF